MLYIILGALLLAVIIVLKIMKGVIKLVLIIALLVIAGVVIANRDETSATSTEISTPAT